MKDILKDLQYVYKVRGLPLPYEALRDGVVLSMDGNPYIFIQTILDEEIGLPNEIRKFSNWFIPRSGALHQGMNMLSCAVSVGFDLFIERFLSRSKRYENMNMNTVIHSVITDYRRSKELFLSQMLFSHIGEIVHAFKLFANSNPEQITVSVSSFREWSKNKNEANISFKLMHEMIFRYFIAIKMHHEGVRHNDMEMKRIAKAHFESLWYLERHQNYIKIQILEQLDILLVRDDIKELLKEFDGFSRFEGVTGIDALLEEFHKEIMQHVQPHATKEQYRRVFANHQVLQDLKESYFESVGTNNYSNAESIRFRPYQIQEIIFHRVCMRILKDEEFITSFNCLSEERINPNLTSIISTGTTRRNDYLDKMKTSRKRCEPTTAQPIFISKERQEEFDRMKYELPSLKRKYDQTIRLWKKILGAGKTAEYSLSCLQHKGKMNSFSTKLKGKNQTKQAKEITKKERVEYLKEQISTIEGDIDIIIQRINGYLSSPLGEYCICTPYTDDGRKMVACSSKDCVQEWYHVECLGIEDTDGKYYCPLCCYLKYQELLTSYQMEGEVDNDDAFNNDE